MASLRSKEIKMYQRYLVNFQRNCSTQLLKSKPVSESWIFLKIGVPAPTTPSFMFLFAISSFVNHSLSLHSISKSQSKENWEHTTNKWSMKKHFTCQCISYYVQEINHQQSITIFSHWKFFNFCQSFLFCTGYIGRCFSKLVVQPSYQKWWGFW